MSWWLEQTFLERLEQFVNVRENNSPNLHHLLQTTELTEKVREEEKKLKQSTAVAKKSINNCLKKLTNAVGRDAAAAVRACPRHFAVVQDSEGNERLAVGRAAAAVRVYC